MSKPQSSNVVNRTGGVQTEDGRTLYGMDAETYLRVKAKEDPEWERQVGQWIEDVLGRAIEDPSDLHKSLKNGVVLCELINKIEPGTIKKYSQPKGTQPLHVLFERENINQYLEACYNLGLSRDALFVTADLHGRRGMASVLANLTALSALVKDKPSLGPNVQSLTELKAKRGPSKWEVNTSYLTPVMIGDIEVGEDAVTKLQTTLQQLQESQTTLRKLEISNDGLKRDIAILRERLRNHSTEKLGLEMKELEEQNQALQAKLNSCLEQLKEKDDLAALLQKENLSIKTDLSFLMMEVSKDSSKLDEVSKTQHSLSEQLSQANDQINQLTQALSANEQALQRKRLKYREAKHQIATEISAGETSLKNTKHFQLEARMLQSELDDLRSTLSDRNTSLSHYEGQAGRLRLLELENQQLQQRIEAFAQTGQQHITASDNLIHEIERLKSLNARITEEVVSLNRTILEKTQMFNQMEQGYTESKRNCESLFRKLEDKSEDSENKSEQIRALKILLENSQNQLKPLKDELKSKERDLEKHQQLSKESESRLKANIQYLNSQYQIDNQNYTKLLQQNQLQKLRISQLETNNLDFETQIAQLKEQRGHEGGHADSKLTADGAQEDTPTYRLSQTIQKLSEKEIAINQYQLQLNAQAEKIKELEKNQVNQDRLMGAMKTKLTAKQNEITRLQGYEKTSVGLTTENEQLYQELQDLKTQLTESKYNEEQLRAQLGSLQSRANAAESSPNPRAPPRSTSSLTAPTPKPEKVTPPKRSDHDEAVPHDRVDPDLVNQLALIFADIGTPGSKPIDQEAVQKLKPLWGSDSGRRSFTYLLKSAIESQPYGAIQLSQQDFEMVLFMINNCLTNLDLKNGADYISAKIIVENAGKIYRNDTGTPEYILQFTKDLYVWQDLWFWTDYFWDLTAKKFQGLSFSSDQSDPLMGDEYSPQQKVFLETEIQNFGQFMLGWGDMKVDTIAMFAENIADSAKLSKDQISSIRENIFVHATPTPAATTSKAPPTPKHTATPPTQAAPEKRIKKTFSSFVKPKNRSSSTPPEQRK